MANPRLIAGRYRLGDELGAGGFGEVFAAEDLLTGESVAVKLLADNSEEVLARVRRETAVLRLLRVPGVVRLLDDGVDDGRAFIVMERCLGQHFPGQERHDWSDLEVPARSLLETLARVHDAGVVHRDLKPANVLVDAAGRATLLDFGIAAGPALTRGLTQAGQVLGTPEWLSPEQLVGETATTRSDLYAVGLMLFESLGGRPAHDAASLPQLIETRMRGRTPRLELLAPSVPLEVAGLIGRLLAPQPAARPRDAGEVCEILAGRGGGGDALVIPRLGGRQVEERLVTAALAGESVRLRGGPGSGRSYQMRRLLEELRSRGRRVAVLAPSRAPFGALEPVLGPPSEFPDAGLAELEDELAERLSAELQAGTTLIADDAEALDAFSTRLLRRCRDSGSIILALAPDDRDAAALCLDPLSSKDLAALFAGHERLFHVPSDAAAVLWEVSEGNPARVAGTLRGWVRAGLARRDGERFRIERATLDQLRSGLVQNRLGTRAVRLPDLGPELDEVLAWCEFGWPVVRAPELAGVLGQPLWQVEASLESLESLNAIRVLGDGRVLPLTQSLSVACWERDERAENHRRLAECLPVASEGRLHHLASSGASLELVSAAVALSRALVAEGRSRSARAALERGRLAAAAAEPPLSAGELTPLLAERCAQALEAGTQRELELALYELTRAGKELQPSLLRYETLLRAALLAVQGDAQRCLHLCDELGEGSSIVEELERQTVRYMAGLRSEPARFAEVLDEIESWADNAGDDRALTRLLEWRGRLAYNEARFADAAGLHRQAATREGRPLERLRIELNAASSLMEAFELDAARELATRLRAEAETLRHPLYEGRGEWILRGSRYRASEALTPDLELVEALAHPALPDYLFASVTFNEAAVAWRSGDVPLAVELAEAARAAWLRTGFTSAAAMARAFALSCAGDPEVDELADLETLALSSRVPAFSLQSLAFLAVLGGTTSAWQTIAPQLATCVAPERWHHPMDILSVAECLERLEVDVVSAAVS